METRAGNRNDNDPWMVNGRVRGAKDQDHQNLDEALEKGLLKAQQPYWVRVRQRAGIFRRAWWQHWHRESSRRRCAVWALAPYSVVRAMLVYSQSFYHGLYEARNVAVSSLRFGWSYDALPRANPAACIKVPSSLNDVTKVGVTQRFRIAVRRSGQDVVLKSEELCEPLNAGFRLCGRRLQKPKTFVEPCCDCQQLWPFATDRRGLRPRSG